MRIFQILRDPSVGFLCIQLLLVIEFNYVLARRRLKERDGTTFDIEGHPTQKLLSPSQGIQAAHRSQEENTPRVQVASGSASSNIPLFETENFARLVSHENPPARIRIENDEHDSSALHTSELLSDASVNRQPRSKKRNPYRFMNKKRLRKKKNKIHAAMAGKPRPARHSRSLSTKSKREGKGHRSSIEHLPNALESLRRLGTDLNILGTELMGLHFPSYLRALMYVVSLIL